MRGRFGRILGYFVNDPPDRHFFASFFGPVSIPRRSVVAFFRQAVRNLAVVCLLLAGICETARADQRRDWMIDIEPVGTFLNLDIVFPGIQATLQHNIPVYGDMNRIRLRANALMTMGFYESQADAEIRILFVTLGLSGGFHGCGRRELAIFQSSEQHPRHRMPGLVGKLLCLFDVAGFDELQNDRIIAAFPYAPPKKETLDDHRQRDHRGEHQRDHDISPFDQDTHNPTVHEVS